MGLVAMVWAAVAALGGEAKAAPAVAGWACQTVAEASEVGVVGWVADWAGGWVVATAAVALQVEAVAALLAAATAAWEAESF